MQFKTDSDKTVRTVTIKPKLRQLIQFDAYFRNTGVYEIQYITVAVEDGNIDRPEIHCRKVSRSSGGYISGDWRVYNQAIEDQAVAYVLALIEAEPDPLDGVAPEWQCSNRDCGLWYRADEAHNGCPTCGSAALV